jgi:hypothetical protein
MVIRSSKFSVHCLKLIERSAEKNLCDGYVSYAHESSLGDTRHIAYHITMLSYAHSSSLAFPLSFP